MGVAYRLIRPEPALKEMASIREDPEWRLTTSPFGVTPEQYATRPPLYVGRAVKWKGKKGLGFEGFKKALIGIGYPVANMERLAAGLGKAIRISKAYTGIKGTTLYEGKLYPKKAIAQKRWKEEHPEIT